MKHWVLVAVLVVLSELSLSDEPVLAPSFVIILCDNLGYGDVGPYGSKLHRTPHLDRMAREGVLFTHFYASAGVCTPSRASLMTGCYAQRVGLGMTSPDGIVLRPVSPNGLHPNEVTIAELLKTKGYSTALIGKWHLGDQAPFLPMRQGFDSYFGIPYSDDMTADKRPQHWPPLPLLENETVLEAPVDRHELTRRYTERALEFIAANGKRPFFLLLAHAMPGSTPAPFAGRAFRGKSRNGPWGDAVEEIDWSTGRILGRLRELQLDRRTLVLWTSDNGAPVHPDSNERGSNGPLFGRGYTTAEGAFRVPAIFWWPDKVPAGRRASEMATMMDVFPTLAALTGTPLPDGRVLDGKDIRPLIFRAPGAESPHHAFYYYHGRQLQAVRSGPWKLFVPLANPVRVPHHQGKGPSPARLFHLAADVGCQRDVAAGHPEVVARLLEQARRARETLGDADRSGTEQREAGRFDHPTPRVLVR